MNDIKRPAGARLLHEFSTETVLALSRNQMIAVHPTFAMPESLRMQDLRSVGPST
jgi:hypothetical protein